MSGFTFSLVPVLWLVFIVFVAYIMGAAINSDLTRKSIWPEKFFLNTTVGLGCLVVFTFILGVVGLWYQVAFIALLFLIIACGFYFQGKQCIYPKFSYSRSIVKHTGLILALLVCFFPVTFNVFYPDSQFDAVTYHLPLVKGWSNDHAMTLDTYLRYPLNALNINLLYTLGYVVHGETLARLFHVLCALLLGCGVYAFGYRFWNRWVGFFAVVFYLVNEQVLKLMYSAYIDLGFSLFVFACLYYLCLYEKSLDSGQKRTVQLMAFMLAMLVGSKYLGLLYLLPISFWAWWLMYKKHQLSYFKHFVVITLVFGGYWYIRNLIYSGNPIHPFAQSFFGYWLWTPADMVFQKSDLLKSTGVDRNWLEFFKLPYHLMFNQELFRHSKIDAINVLGMVCSIPAIFQSSILRKIGLFVLFNVVFWFFSSQIPRYLLATLPFFSILAAFYLYFLISLLIKWVFEFPIKLQMKRYAVILGASVLILFGVEQTVKYYRKGHYFRPIPKNHNEWLSYNQKNPVYQLGEAANKHGALGGLYNLGLRHIFYYYDGQVMGDWFGEANMGLLVQSRPDKFELIEELESHKASYIVIGKNNKLRWELIDKLRDQPEFELLTENNKGIVFYLKKRQ